MSEFINVEGELAKLEALQFPHRRFEDTMNGRQERKAMAAKKEQEHTIQDTIEEMKAMNAGAWCVVQPPGGQPVAHFVKRGESGQYNLMTDSEYPSEQNANLALALMTRPTQLTHQERVDLLSLLEKK